MLEIREEEMNMVNGGMNLSQIASMAGLYRPKFEVGENVMSKTDPELGVGTVTGIDFNGGYFYTVEFRYGQLYAPEDQLEFAVTK